MRAEDIPKLFKGGPGWSCAKRVRSSARFETLASVDIACIESRLFRFDGERTWGAEFNSGSERGGPVLYKSTKAKALIWLRERYREHWRNLGLIMGVG